MSEFREIVEMPGEDSYESGFDFGRACAVDSILRSGAEGFEPKSGRMQPVLIVLTLLVLAGAGAFLAFDAPSGPQDSLAPVELDVSLPPMAVKEFKGRVTVIFEDGREFLVKPDLVIESGQAIATSLGAEAIIAAGEGLRARLSERARMYVRFTDEGREVELERGSVEFEVTPDGMGRGMRISSERGYIDVSKGVFTVDSSASRLQVAVDSGEVKVARRQNDGAKPAARIVVGEGMLFRSSESGDLTSFATDQPPRVQSYSLVDVATGKPVPGYENLRNVSTLYLSELPQKGLTIVANVTGSARQVVFTSARPRLRHVDSFVPYSAAGDSIHEGGEFKRFPLKSGQLNLSVRVVDMKGAPAFNHTIRMTIKDKRE